MGVICLRLDMTVELELVSIRCRVDVELSYLIETQTGCYILLGPLYYYTCDDDRLEQMA